MLGQRYSCVVQRAYTPQISMAFNKKFQSHQPQEIKEKPVLQDNFGRRHSYLRISLTEKCNFRCGYCMPENGIKLTSKENLLNTDEMLHLVKLFVKQGVSKVRLTGGEPTVHKDLKYIIECLNKIEDLKTIAMTTNGLVLTTRLRELQRAGLNALNISLDTLNEKKFETITRRKGWSKVMSGIDYALQSGYDPVKVNCVVIKTFNDDEILNFVDLTRDRNIHVRFIEYMPFGGNKWHSTKMVTYAELLSQIYGKYPQFRAVKTEYNDTNKLYEVPGFIGRVGFISSITDNFCGSCNRLRLLADGSLKVCLLGSAEVSLRDALRGGCSEDDILALISAAVLRKKKQHAGFSDKDSDAVPSSILLYNTTWVLQNRSKFFNTVHSRFYSSFSHITDSGKVTMVDVGSKNETRRCASAYAEVYVGNEIVKMIHDHEIKKGDVLSIAKLAGIMAAKNTSFLIPLCHNIILSFVDVRLKIENEYVKVTSEVRCNGQTGVEMEALTAVTIAALTVYDMCKAVSHDISIQNVKLLMKNGGKHDFMRYES